MLDLFTIFSKGGIVLWCFQGTCQSFTLPVNELIRSVILQVSLSFIFAGEEVSELKLMLQFGGFIKLKFILMNFIVLKEAFLFLLSCRSVGEIIHLRMALLH